MQKHLARIIFLRLLYIVTESGRVLQEILSQDLGGTKQKKTIHQGIPYLLSMLLNTRQLIGQVSAFLELL